MAQPARAVALLALLAAPTGCLLASEREARVELRAAGTGEGRMIPARDGATIILDRADLALGPLTLCAGRQAGDLCEEALAEWTGSTVVDALDSEPRRAGWLVGLTGAAQSYMYDLGIVSVLTQPRPVPLEAARKLRGHSLVLEGTVRLPARAVPFRAELTVARSEEAERGMPLVRKSQGERFQHRLRARGDRLLMRFDPRPWLSGVDLTPLLGDRSCEAGGPAIVCTGNLAQTCAADGSPTTSRDCAENGQVCVNGTGCAERLDLGADEQTARSIQVELLAGARPTFEWSREPN